jgi:hypothetical protein
VLGAVAVGKDLATKMKSVDHVEGAFLDAEEGHNPTMLPLPMIRLLGRDSSIVKHYS